MPLNFESRLGSAFDPGSGLVIHEPRVLPASPPESQEHDEYQYAFYRDGRRIDGLGLFGTDSRVEKAGRRERVFTLDLGRGWVLDSVLGLKKTLGNEDDDFSFLQGLARGLVVVYETRTRVAYDLRYVAVTDPTVLAERGIEVPDGVTYAPAPADPAQPGRDLIVLAEVLVPARALPESAA